MDDQEKPKSLVSKLAEVMAATERVPKNGWNDFHKYKFARESDIVESIRRELACRNILITPSILAHERTETVNSKGNKSYFTLINVDWSIRDGDSDQVIRLQIPGTADDTGDKGFYKAFTGSEKYLLTKTFLIPTGDDPENDDGKSNNAAPAQSAPTGRHYDLKPVPSATAPPRATEEEEYGKSVGVVGKINPAEDGKCWFLSIGHLGTAKGETIWCKDKTLVDSLKVGMEIQASLRSKAPGKYQLLSFVPVDDGIPGIAK
jgi:ERF superfamily